MTALFVALSLFLEVSPDGGEPGDGGGLDASVEDGGLPTGGGTGGGNNTGGGSGTGGSGTGGGGTAVDAGGGTAVDAGGGGTSDAGLPVDEAWADLAWTPAGDVTAAVWVDERRDLAFAMPRRRLADLWANAWRPDAGFNSPYGQIICPTSSSEVFSLPRIAASQSGAVVVAWRVSMEGVPGHAIRAVTLSAAGVSSCSQVVVPNDGMPITSLRLRESLGDFLLVWTTAGEVRGQYLRSSASPPFTIANAIDPIVTLASTDRGFVAAWDQRGVFWSVDLPTFTPGSTPPPAQASFPDQMPVTQATAAGPQSSGAFIGGAGPRNVFFGPVTIADNPVPGPQAGEHPLVTATLGDTHHFVAHESATPGRFQVTEFGTMVSWTPLFPAGLVPQAMVTDGRRGLLLLGGRVPTLTVVQLVSQPTGQLTLMTPFNSTQPSPDQLGNSLVRTAAGGWLLGWNEGLVTGAHLFGPDGAPGLVTLRPRAGGGSLLTQVADGPGLAVNVSGSQVTNVYPFTMEGGADTTSPLLTASGEHRVTLVGNLAAAVWTAGGAAITFGRGAPPPLNLGGARLGRCGAWVDNAFFIPMLENGGDLRIVELKDEVGAVPVVHPVGPGPRGAPCLVARGTELLVVAAGDSTGGLFVAMSTVADVRANHPARIIPIVASSNARAVGLVAAAPTPRGWQLAWESLDETTSVIAGMVLTADGTVLAQPTALALGLDERAPSLAPSSGGLVALSWEHFADQTGNVQVKTSFLAQDGNPTDAGVALEPDAGVDVDAGLNPMQPIIYSSCGCQAGALPSLLGLVLVLLTRRRARARS